MAEEKAAIYITPLFHAGAGDDQRTETGRAFASIAGHLSACRGDDAYALSFPDQEHLGNFLRFHSEERPFARELAEAGRLDAPAAYYSPADPAGGGEALLRNLVRGMGIARNLLQLTPSVCLVKSGGQFGLQFPQLLSKLGVEAILWLEEQEGLPPLSHWMAPDGSAVILKISPAGEWPEDANQLVAWAVRGFNEQTRLGVNWELALVNAGEAPPAWLLGRAEEMANLTPAVALGTPGRYLSAAAPEAHLLRASLPCVGQDPGGAAEVSAGSWELGRAARWAEDAVARAERMTALAHAAGARGGKDSLEGAWEQLLYARAHADTEDEARRRDLLASLQEAACAVHALARRAGEYIAAHVNTRDTRGAPRQGAALVVFNTAPWPRTDVCEAQVELEETLASGFEVVDERGRPTPAECVRAPQSSGGTRRLSLRFLASDVPALGWRTWYLRPARSLPPVCEPVEADSAALENEFAALRAEAAAGGLTSLREKSSGRELLSPALGAAAQATPLGNASPTPARLAVWEGPVTKSVHLRHPLPDGREVEQQISLQEGGRRVEMLTAVRGTGGSAEGLALRLPLALPVKTAMCSAPFGAVLRYARNARIRSAGGEIGLWLARDWVDLGRPPSLLVRCGKDEDRAVPLGPCALIAAGDIRQRGALRPLEQALLSRGVPFSTFADTSDLEAHAHEHALRISLGRDNAYSKRLLDRHPLVAAALERALSGREWAAALAPSGGPRSPAAAIPTLIADHRAPRNIAALVERLARAVRDDRLEVPEEQDFFLEGPQDQTMWNGGVTLLGTAPLAVAAGEPGTVQLLLEPPGETRKGRRRWRHALAAHAGDWREGQADREAWEFSHPLAAVQTGLHPGALPPEYALCALDHPALVVTTVRPREAPGARRAGEGAQIVLRMYESHGKPCPARIKFGAAPEAVWRCDLREERREEVPVNRPRRGLLRGRAEEPTAAMELAANEIATVGLRLPSLAEAPPKAEPLDPPVDPQRAFFSRFWEHNAGAAWTSHPLTLWMRGELPRGKNTRFGLGLSNDSDREVSGTVEVEAPPEWTMIPRQVPYRIAPWSEAVYEIMVIVPPDASPCFVRAHTRTDWGIVQDALPVGEIVPLSVSLTREEGGCVVIVENPNPDHVEGEIHLLLPPDSWPEEMERGFSPMRPFRVEAKARAEIRLALAGEGPAWASARVAWYGHVQYAHLTPRD